jgi:hypothetical protein
MGESLHLFVYRNADGTFHAGVVDHCNTLVTGFSSPKAALFALLFQTDLEKLLRQEEMKAAAAIELYVG